MALKYPSADWIKELETRLNASEGYARAAATWEGDCIFVILPDADYKETSYAYIDLQHGKASGARMLQSLDEQKALFTMTAPFGIWRKVMEGRARSIAGDVLRQDQGRRQYGAGPADAEGHLRADQDRITDRNRLVVTQHGRLPGPHPARGPQLRGICGMRRSTKTMPVAYVGGSGLAARYLYDMLDACTDPLGPDNPLFFLTGPLVGTSMSSAGRYSACARSPLTGIWGEANSGGFFGPELRYAGYDGVLITGKSEQPVWLSVVNGKAELHAAGDLWGSDIYVTQTRLRETLGDAAGARGLHRPRRRESCEAGRHCERSRSVRGAHWPRRGDGLQESQGNRWRAAPARFPCMRPKNTRPLPTRSLRCTRMISVLNRFAPMGRPAM